MKRKTKQYWLFYSFVENNIGSGVIRMKVKRQPVMQTIQEAILSSGSLIL